MLLPSLVAFATFAAPGWETSFTPAVVADYLDGVDRSVLVAGAGPAGSGAAEAALMLQNALRASGKVKLVVDGASLGDLTASTDPQIVSQAYPMPVELVLVVRVFAGEDGRPPRASVVMLGKDGSAQGAYSAEKGVPVAPRDELDRLRAVPRVAFEARDQGRAVVQSFDPKVENCRLGPLGFFHDPETLGSDWKPAHRGPQKREVRNTQFYELVDRRDLASAYRVRQGVKATAIGVGVAAIVSGVITMAVAGIATATNDSDKATRERAALGGGIVAGVGVSFAVFGSVLAEHPVDGKEAKRLADEYNRKLATECR